MAEHEEKPLMRRECDRCQLKTEVSDMKEWVRGIDKRQWIGFVLAFSNLLAALGALVVLVFKMLPALAAAQGK